MSLGVGTENRRLGYSVGILSDELRRAVVEARPKTIYSSRYITTRSNQSAYNISFNWFVCGVPMTETLGNRFPGQRTLGTKSISPEGL